MMGSLRSTQYKIKHDSSPRLTHAIIAAISAGHQHRSVKILYLLNRGSLNVSFPVSYITVSLIRHESNKRRNETKQCSFSSRSCALGIKDSVSQSRAKQLYIISQRDKSTAWEDVLISSALSVLHLAPKDGCPSTLAVVSECCLAGVFISTH
jgi:hypothetical protein